MSPGRPPAIPLGEPFPDWAESSIHRPLPRTVRPVRDETLKSYLRRLGEANAMNPHHFSEWVMRGKKRRPQDLAQAVIILSGQPPASVRYAILELCAPEELLLMHVAGRPRPGRRERPMCSRCAAGRGELGSVWRWTREEDAVCLPHRRWVGDGGQVNLAGHDDIVRAGRRHWRLIRRHGRRAASRAYNMADLVIFEWAERGSYRDRVEERLLRFHAEGLRVWLGDPTAHASRYPSAVALARLLASPRWTQLALDPAGNAAFTAEVRRTVEPRYAWNSRPHARYVEPLARTLLEDRELREQMSRAEEFPWARRALRGVRGQALEPDESLPRP
jgi:hypothetical protein